MLKPVNLAEFTLGMDQLSNETSLPRGACRDALNVEFDIYGNFRSRSGWTAAGAMTGAHSLWGALDGTFGLFAQDDKLKRLVVNAGLPMVATIMSGLSPSTRMSFHEHADQVFFTNGRDLGVVGRASASLIGIDVPTITGAAALDFGSVPAGKYKVAISYVLPTGEESGLSDIASVELPTQGGIDVFTPAVPGFASGASKLRTYCTPVNGDVLYLAGEYPLRMSGTYDITDLKLSKQADNMNMTRLRGGAIVRGFNGRVMVANGDVLQFSQPFRYGLTKINTDFVRFNSRIVMVEPVVDGVYVGVLEGTVYFLAGGGPSEFEQRVVSSTRPIPYASSVVAPGRLPRKIAEKNDQNAVLWLGAMGYSLGLAGGMVMDIQSDRISLPAYTAGSTTVLTNAGIKQILSVVESAETAGQGSAIDS